MLLEKNNILTYEKEIFTKIQFCWKLINMIVFSVFIKKNFNLENNLI